MSEVQVLMETQTGTAALDAPRVVPGVAGLRESLNQFDRWLGAAYSRLSNRRLAQPVGRVLAALLLGLLVFGKWHAVTRLFGASRVDGDLTTWMVVFNHLLQVVFLSLSALLVIARRPARTGTARFSGILVALGGSFAASLLVVESNGGLRADLAPLAVLLLLAGMGWAIWSLAVLGRCFSVLPEVRGLVTSGPYRWVRHPVYLGEIVATLGLMLPILSTRNVAVFVLFCALQLWRTRHEEAGLAGTFPEYVEYRRRTARLLPGLW